MPEDDSNGWRHDLWPWLRPDLVAIPGLLTKATAGVFLAWVARKNSEKKEWCHVSPVSYSFTSLSYTN